MRKQPLVVGKQVAGFNDTILSALILAIANMGDAFLYAYLPAYYQQIGISSFWVGIILSVNRFTRLFLNGRVAWLLNSKGVKVITLFASLMASLTTISYGWINAIPLWILARVLWGLCFSVLRLGNTLYALEHPRKGIALGISRAIIESGPVIALLTGGFLLELGDRHITFLVFGLVNFVSVLFAFSLNNLRTEAVSKKDLILSLPSSFNLLVLINAFITEGVLVVLLGRLVENDQTLVLVAPLAVVGFLLGYRRLSLVFLSPVSGWLADKYGFRKIFIYSIIFSIGGLVLILLGATVAGILLTFTFSAINASSATGGAINSKHSIIKSVTDNATWRDIGTAIGAFTGALLLPVYNSQMLIPVLLLLYATGLFYYRSQLEK